MPTPTTPAEDDTPQRRGWLVAVLILVTVCGGGFYEFLGKKPVVAAQSVPAAAPVIICSFHVDEPKPKPPEEPKITPNEPKMIVEDHPIAVPPTAPPEETPPPLGTNVAAGGPPDSFGLTAYHAGAEGNGDGHIGGGTKCVGVSRFGSYAAQVQSRIADAMRRNERVKQALFANVEAKIWVDKLGKIQRAKVFGSNGTPSDEDLIGLQLISPPPDDMPMPIVLRLNARKTTL
jgi:periplasmic protein TonB